jgi:hypothetical protein
MPPLKAEGLQTLNLVQRLAEAAGGASAAMRAAALLGPPEFPVPAGVNAVFRRRRAAQSAQKFFLLSTELPPPIGYCAAAGWWTTNMRALLLGLIFSAVALPCLAQTILKSEPLVLAPYEIAFVQDASCPAGKVLKVTGAIRGLHRRKACVALAAEQASLAVATP